MQRVLFIFLDGVGIGASDRDRNPFLRAQLPTIRELTGGRLPTLDEPVVRHKGGGAFPLAATLDVDGTPQSGTGQVALLTGASAAELNGGHFGPWTPVRLRHLVESESLLRHASDAGRSVAFANAYPRGWPGSRGSRAFAGPPLAARGAGLMTRHEEALGAGDAVSSEIVNDGWREQLGHDWLAPVTAKQAGVHLAAIAATHDLTLFAHYTTDAAGHRRDMDDAVTALERVDSFLAGVVSTLATDTLLIVASDHGNVEDVTTGHTKNPVLGIASGPGAGGAVTMRDLRQVAPFILATLEIH